MTIEKVGAKWPAGAQKLKFLKSLQGFPEKVPGFIKIVFDKKWCAALSSVVCLGAPSGKKSASTQMCYFQKCASKLTPALKV